MTRRLFLQFLSALPFWRPKSTPVQLTSIAFPLIFPDGLDGKGEPRRFYLPVMSG